MSAQAEFAYLFEVDSADKLFLPFFDGDHIIPGFQIEKLEFVLFASMSGGTGPFVSPWKSANLCPDRVSLDIFGSEPETFIIQSARVEPSFPEMACSFVHPVDILGIAKICSADCFGERIFRLRNSDKVDMVCHEAISENIEAVAAAIIL